MQWIFSYLLIWLAPLSHSSPILSYFPMCIARTHAMACDRLWRIGWVFGGAWPRSKGFHSQNLRPWTGAWTWKRRVTTSPPPRAPPQPCPQLSSTWRCVWLERVCLLVWENCRILGSMHICTCMNKCLQAQQMLCSCQVEQQPQSEGVMPSVVTHQFELSKGIPVLHV